MARPKKTGLDYFPLDVDIDQDDKIAIIEAQHGAVGFAIIVKLLMRIYKNGYFYEWTEKEQLLFSRNINVDINSINVIINDCVKWGLFDGKAFETFEILTSRGIQRRYLEAVGRRKKVSIDRDHLLLDGETISEYKNLVIVDNNTHSSVVNADINPQSKVKESKVKNSTTTNIDNLNNIDASNELNQNNSSSSESEFNDIVKLYSENIELPNQLTSEWIIDTLNEYGYTWLKNAIIIANQNGKRKQSYIRGILDNWKTNGGMKLVKDKHAPSQDHVNHNYDMDDIEKVLWEKQMRGETNEL